MVSYLFLVLLTVVYGQPEKMLFPGRLLNEVEVVPETTESGAVDNSTFVPDDYESYEKLFPLAAVNADGSGRRSLLSRCSTSSISDTWYSPQFNLNTVKFNSKCANPHVPYKQDGNFIPVAFEVEDVDSKCPGCIEQVHYGFWNKKTGEGNKLCVNLGGGNFGRRIIANYFFLPRGEYTFFVQGSWQYHCVSSDWSSMPSSVFWRGISSVQDVVIS